MKNAWPALIFLIFVTGIVFLFFFIVVRGPLNKQESLETDLANLTEPLVTIVDPKIGASNPQVTIVVFSDFACSHCSTTAANLSQVVAAYPNDVQLVWKDFPNTNLHPTAKDAAVAARCADKQDMFWEYHDFLFANQGNQSTDNLILIASELNLDLDDFNRCLTNQETLPVVQKTFEEGQSLGVMGTPTLYINGDLYSGNTAPEILSSFVTQQIK